MVAAPAFVAATLGPGNRSFSSPWFILGALAFVGVLGCVVAQQLPRVIGGDLQVITSSRLATEAWLKATPPQFKWNLLLWAADDWDSNRALVDRMVSIATFAAVLLGVQVASLAIWVLVR